ncbi:MAG: hypothetical protein ABR540_22760 [Acidimicrobiales bacterium]
MSVLSGELQRPPLVLTRWSVVAAAVAVFGGVAISVAPIGSLSICLTAFVGAVVVLEVLRRRAVPAVPWWTAHVAIIPWATIVLPPWVFFVSEGHWSLLGVPLSLSLTHTWTIHLLALIGLTAGAALALLPSRSRLLSDAEGVNWSKVSTYIGGAMVLYLVSFVLAQRPLAALWRLSGDIRYFDNPDQATGLGVLDYMTTLATGILLVVAAARRRNHAYPPLTEVGWLLVLTVIALGSGSRGRLYLVVVGWLIIQARPMFTRASPIGRAGLTIAGAGLIILALSVAGTISVLRTRGAEGLQGTSVELAIRGFDVIGSGELLVMRGGTPGVLAGRSYSEFPQLLIPRRYAGDEKTTPSADALFRDRIDPNAGFSAPFWFEPMLNFGKGGVLVFSAAFSWLAVTLLRRSPHQVGNRFAACVHRLGPVWVLLGYLALSRVTGLQLLLTVGSMVAGVYAGSRCVRSVRSNVLAWAGVSPVP